MKHAKVKKAIKQLAMAWVPWRCKMSAVMISFHDFGIVELWKNQRG
jgi:hypothetical protein